MDNSKRTVITIKYVGNIEYFEYILTGFYQLSEQDKNLEFRYTFCKIKVIIRTFFQKLNWKTFKSERIQSFFHKHFHLCVLEVIMNKKKYIITLDSNDTPYHFFENDLVKSDIYYKFQCPQDLEKGFYVLNSQNIIKFSDKVQLHIKKIKPLIEPRPLSKTMNFKKNCEILDMFSRRRNEDKERSYNMLAYFGNARDNYTHTNIDHPHKKRLRVLAAIQKFDYIKTIFSGADKRIESKEDDWQIYYNQLRIFRDKVTNNIYRDWCFSSKSTLNIAGLRGSIPFRFMDAFLSNMIIVTDTPHVKWYFDFHDCSQIIDIGEMGYEIITDSEFDNRVDRILESAQSIDGIRKCCKFNYYDKYLRPDILGEKILSDIQQLNN